VCGNGIREGTEKCDGTNFGGATCAGVLGAGYTGTLKCYAAGTSNECKFDTSSCILLVLVLVIIIFAQQIYARIMPASIFQ